VIPALLLCVLSLCSDDMVGVLGNERICWDAAARAGTYDLAADGTACVSVIAPETCTTLPPECRGEALRVRACNAAGCGGWSGPVEVLPFACVRQRLACTFSDDGDARNDRCEVCEYPCFSGAPRRLLSVPECTP
jgi:hypothetical protein